MEFSGLSTAQRLELLVGIPVAERAHLDRAPLHLRDGMEVKGARFKDWTQAETGWESWSFGGGRFPHG